MSLIIDELKRAEMLRQEIYASPNGGSGCCWHLVLDDENETDDIVQWCLANSVRADHPSCVELGRLLLRMSRTQRLKLASWGYRHLCEPTRA